MRFLIDTGARISEALVSASAAFRAESAKAADVIKSHAP